MKILTGPKIPKAPSEPEERFALTWRALGGPEFHREYRFSPGRKWQFDFAWPLSKIAVEIDGGIHEGPARGRHMRQDGYERDAEKLNTAALMGWRCLRLSPAMIQPALLNRIILELGRSL